MLERTVKDRVKRVLNKYEAYYYMPVPGGYGAATLDFIGCVKGYYFSIETKAPGKKPTARQKVTITRMREAGGKVFVIDGDCSELESWLQIVTTKPKPMIKKAEVE